jgi:hypothetical protein
MERGNVKGQATLLEFPDTRSKFGMLHDPLCRSVRHIAKRCVAFVFQGQLAHSTKPLRSPRQRQVKQFAHLLAEAHVGMSDNRRSDSAGTVGAAGTHRRNSICEFDLVQWSQMLRAIGARECERFHINARHDVVPGTDIR